MANDKPEVLKLVEKQTKKHYNGDRGFEGGKSRIIVHKKEGT